MGRRSVPRAVAEIIRGRPVVLTTGAEPDAEGCLVVAAESATTEVGPCA
jgi:3,4-dihydroxy-2-butanone 4-phosphate synthase